MDQFEPATTGPSSVRSLVQLAKVKELPRVQYMDVETLRWIGGNRPDFGRGASSPLPAPHPSAADALRRAAAIPASWYAEPHLAESLHGVRHGLRTAANAALLAASTTLPVQDQAAVVVAAAIHDCRRHHDKDDPGHGTRSSAWLEASCDVVAQHFRTGFTPGQVRAMQVAVRLHDVPYAHFSQEQRHDRQQAAEMVDVLKTADALDRYRLPKLKWWFDPSLVWLRPPANLAHFAFELVYESETRHLTSGGGAGSVLSVLTEWGWRERPQALVRPVGRRPRVLR